MKNVLDFFKERQPAVRDYDSNFVRAAHAFYVKCTTHHYTTMSQAEEGYAELMKVPMSYSDMRGMFG